jgi:hypothetical protein
MPILPLPSQTAPIAFSDCGADAVPFESAEAAWFWYIAAAQAMADGARIKAGLSVVRPCEPVDIFRAVEVLYRRKSLTMDHVLVLRHYGRRGLAPDKNRAKEIRAARLWQEALEKLSVIFEQKKIITPQTHFFFHEMA